MCLIPKHNELEGPKTEAEERREKKTNVHNTFINEMGVLMDLLDNKSESGINDDSLEKRILNGVKGLKEKWLRVEEERDLLRNNNQELESKLGQLLAGTY